MGRSRFLLLLPLLVCAAQAAGYHFEAYSISGDMQQDGSVRETVEMLLVNDGQYPISELEYAIAYEPEDVRAEAGGRSAEHFVEQGEGGYFIVVRFHEPVAPAGKSQMRLQFTINNVARKMGENHMFSLRYAPTVPVRDFTLELSLPRGAGLAATARAGMGETAVSPSPSKLYTDGERIMVGWQRDELGEDGISAIIVYRTYGIPFYKSAYFWAPVAGALLLYIAYAYHKPKKRDIVSIGLSEDERKIVGLLGTGETTQKELIRQANFSKPKMSKIIRRLEEKGVIEKKPYHRTNKIRLSRKVR